MSTCAAPIVRRSVHEESRQEANRHKWIESEKAGRDLGDEAIMNWVRTHWHPYLRAKWIEHLEGSNFWFELGPSDFGIMKTTFGESPYVPEIFRQLKDRGENLSILLWAQDNNLDMEEILSILVILDINRKRLECQLVSQLRSHGG